MVHCSKFTPLFELLLNWCHLKILGIVITLKLSTAVLSSGRNWLNFHDRSSEDVSDQ